MTSDVHNFSLTTSYVSNFSLMTGYAHNIFPKNNLYNIYLVWIVEEKKEKSAD
jgi:hypothetical protein